MFSFRRLAFRALSLPSTSISAKARSLTTITQLTVPRASRQSFILPVQRRLASDDVTRAESGAGAEAEVEKAGFSDAPESADEDDHSAVASAVSATTENATARTSDAAETVAEAMGTARDTVTNAAQAAAASVGGSASRDFSSADPPSPSKNLYVGNLFFDVTEEDLKKEMERFGTITDIKIIMDARGLSKGFGYVEYSSQEEATQAQENLNQAVFEGRRMTVQYTRPREPRTFTSLGAKNSPSKTLFIGNMSFDMSDQDLNDMFRHIKNVVDVRVAIDRRTGQPRGFAHADFTDVASAEKALEELKDKEVYGRKLRLDYSVSKLKDQRGPVPRRSAEGSRY